MARMMTLFIFGLDRGFVGVSDLTPSVNYATPFPGDSGCRKDSHARIFSSVH